MKIDERVEGDVVILTLSGEMCAGDGDVLLHDTMTRLIAAGRRKVVLDLGDVPYVDSASLGELVVCYTSLSRVNGELKLKNLRRRAAFPIARLFDLENDDDGDDDKDDGEWPSGAGGVTGLGETFNIKPKL